MSASQAGLGAASRGSRIFAAVLLVLVLITILSPVTTQAAPISSPSSTNSFHGSSSARIQRNSDDHSQVPVHVHVPVIPAPFHASPLGFLREREPGDNEEIGTVVLVRRKSIAAKIRAAFHKIGHKIKHAFQKVGHAIKTAAKKVGHFIKKTGAKIAKVGLKIAATVGKVAGKVIGFIPGVGKAAGKVLEGASEGMNKASDAIHAHIGGKLGKAMHRMDKAQKIVGYIP